MKLTLIKPNIGRQGHSLYVDEGRMEPLQLGVLAALTPPDVEVVLYDDRMEPIPYDEPTDLVAITVETFTARRAYEIADEYRQRGVRVIMGGMHPTLLPEEVSQHADAVMVGDAEHRWQEAIEDARAGKLQPLYLSQPGCPQPGVQTRRDLFKGKGYLPLSLIQASRGCRHACTFCATSRYFGARHFLRPVPEIVREIEEQGLKFLFFVDDNIISDVPAAKELFRALIPLKVKWVSQATITMADDPELLDLMVKSGCQGLVVGFESIDLDNLERMNKAPNLSSGQGFKRQLDILRDAGLQLWAAFTIGHDHDDAKTAERILEFSIMNKFCFAAFNVLVPYPNTPFYSQLQQEGRLLYDGKWWLHPEYRFNHAAYLPRNMTPEELTESSYRARAGFNSLPSIVKRALDWKTNMRNPYRFGIYLTYNLLIRKEVHKKQGMAFGLTKQNYLSTSSS
ncbi:MAG: B12-binding domain-containing radical SAM protein [Bacteroidota bacterium]